MVALETPGNENCVHAVAVCEAEDSGEGSGSEVDSSPVAEIEEAVLVLLQGLGEDYERDGIRKTPQRVAKAFREGTRGYGQKAKDVVQGALFPEVGLDTRTGYAGGTGGLVVVRDINLFSYCESCLLPFRVLCHVGYVPSGQRVVGLSKIARVADVFAKRLQEPQRLANEICSALQNSIKPAGVVIALQCWHIQFPKYIPCNTNQEHPSKLDMQGWVRTVVTSKSGVFEDEKNSLWDDFCSLLKLNGTKVERGKTRAHSWCPSKLIEVPQCNGQSHNKILNGTTVMKPGAIGAGMITAVTSIIRSLGEDPLRKELVGTPHRYVQWLMNFKNSSMDTKFNGHSLGKVNLHRTLSVEVGDHHNKIHSELHLPFCSQCEHHLLPFYGVVHVGYFNDHDDKYVERATLQSMVHFYACKLQVQERMTRQIVEAVYSACKDGVIVVVEANHICMVSRGIEKLGSSTATIAVAGKFSNDRAAKALFLDIISSSTTSEG